MIPLIPVLDILGGKVVRAIGGRRNEYRPIQSTLTKSTEPFLVAQAMLAATGADRLYVADLDGIIHRQSSTSLLKELSALPCRIMFDPGIRTADDAALVSDTDEKLHAIVATETVLSPLVLADLRKRYPRREVVLSVDLFDGHLLGDWQAWGLPAPMAVEALVERSVEVFGIREVIVLDLAWVGRRDGPGTLSMVVALARRHPKLRVISGGGVRGWKDVRRFCDAGASGVLISSALHDGTMFPTLV